MLSQDMFDYLQYPVLTFGKGHDDHCSMPIPQLYHLLATIGSDENLLEEYAQAVSMCADRSTHREWMHVNCCHRHEVGFVKKITKVLNEEYPTEPWERKTPKAVYRGSCYPTANPDASDANTYLFLRGAVCSAATQDAKYAPLFDVGMQTFCRYIIGVSHVASQARPLTLGMLEAITLDTADTGERRATFSNSCALAAQSAMPASPWGARQWSTTSTKSMWTATAQPLTPYLYVELMPSAHAMYMICLNSGSFVATAWSCMLWLMTRVRTSASFMRRGTQGMTLCMSTSAFITNTHHRLLQPWAHYIPVTPASMQKAVFDCVKYDDKCRQIARQGWRLAQCELGLPVQHRYLMHVWDLLARTQHPHTVY